MSSRHLDGPLAIQNSGTDISVSRANCYVALKILAAKSGSASHELRTLKSLDRGTSHAGRKHVQQLLDHFEHKGPNGRHQCLVLELMGRNFNDYLFQFEYSPPFERGKPLPLSFKRQVCKQLVMALDYLHVQGIMHRDIHQGNILFALNYQIDDLSEQEVQSDLDSTENEYKADGVLVRRVDGQPLTNGEPEYLLEPIPLKDNVSATALPPELRIILADFGASCRFDESNDGDHAYPFLLQAPEVILKLPFGEKADIWDLGCVIFEIMQTARPFDAWSVFGTEDEKRDELLYAIVDRLGPLPQILRSHLPRSPKMTGLSESESYGDLRQHMEGHRAKDMSDVELDAFESFIRSTLQYEPNNRASTQDLLQHPWFVDF